MHPKTKYIFIASMDVTPEKEALFNELYDTEHVPLLLKVPGVLSAIRVTTEPLTMFVDNLGRFLDDKPLKEVVDRNAGY